MKIEYSNNFSYPDTIWIRFSNVYVRLCFYPISCWTWEWSIDWSKSINKHFRGSINIETPTMTVYAMTHPNLSKHED